MGKYAKFIVAAVTAALVAVSDQLPVGSSTTQWINLALAVVGAIGVVLVPNAPAQRHDLP
jgi:hypothetical protein